MEVTVVTLQRVVKSTYLTTYHTLNALLIVQLALLAHQALQEMPVLPTLHRQVNIVDKILI